MIEAWWLEELAGLKADGEESTEQGQQWAEEVAKSARQVVSDEGSTTVIISPPTNWALPACVGPMKSPSQQASSTDGQWLTDDDAECCSVVVVSGTHRPVLWESVTRFLPSQNRFSSHQIFFSLTVATHGSGCAGYFR